MQPRGSLVQNPKSLEPDFGLICGTRRGPLPLLPSGPGGVREHPSHRARSLTQPLRPNTRNYTSAVAWWPEHGPSGRALAPLEFLQIFPELRLSPRNVPGVDHKDDPDQGVGREEIVVSHAAPQEQSPCWRSAVSHHPMIRAGQAGAAASRPHAGRPIMPCVGAQDTRTNTERHPNSLRMSTSSSDQGPIRIRP
jgi:hypothetical protein